MIIVKFQYTQRFSQGQLQYLNEEIKLFDDTIPAKELESEIKEFLNDSQNGYRTNIIVKSIERI